MSSSIVPSLSETVLRGGAICNLYLTLVRPEEGATPAGIRVSRVVMRSSRCRVVEMLLLLLFSPGLQPALAAALLNARENRIESDDVTLATLHQIFCVSSPTLNSII